ncbi:MAG: SDR family oxidoreductase [Propionibacteriaceae bacterium]|jgi:NAD(P)-dependent dehydrogenase (short-subunit alcohol dehydrogenase family)|nr:SDR family oxidoreductase [Propionibacteriaceae bacterium]
MTPSPTPGAIVTGGNRGIGAGIVARLVADGYDVVFSHLGQQDLADEVVASCPSGKVTAVDIDFRSPTAAAELVERAWQVLDRVDALVCNAGRGYSERIQDLEVADIDSVYAINFRGPLLMAKEVANRWISQGQSGAIVNIGSVRGLRPDPVDAIYGGLKAGLHRATQSLALEFSQYGIRVNAVSPGTIEVFDRPDVYRRLAVDIPLGRTGTPADIAAAVAFLLSNQASYITGVTLPVDGGMPLPITYGGEDIGQGNRWGQIQATRRTPEFQREPGGYQGAPRV